MNFDVFPTARWINDHKDNIISCSQQHYLFVKAKHIDSARRRVLIATLQLQQCGYFIFTPKEMKVSISTILVIAVFIGSNIISNW